MKASSAKQKRYTLVVMVMLLLSLHGLAASAYAKTASKTASQSSGKSSSSKSAKKKKKATKTKSSTKKSSTDKTKKSSTKKSSKKKKSKKQALKKLQTKLNSAIRGYGGSWSVYVENLDTGESISINNRPMYAASLIKLYAMGAAYDRINRKKLAETALMRTVLTNLITISDNWSFNYLVKTVGKGNVNSWISSQKFKNTQVIHGLSPSGNADGIRTGPGQNTTSVNDCGKMLASIYRGTCVNKTFSRKMLALLAGQTRRSKIPAGVPGGVKVANKTGETNTTCHDAAIVYSKGADYVIVVMVTSGGAWGKNGQIANLSRITYQYFNS